MSAPCTMEVMDASGHVTLQWDPNNPESVAKAKAEADRLLEAGFTFFATTDVEVAAPAGSASADLTPAEVPVQTREFRPRARRQVAVAPMRGG